jgi:hypothetical protein
MMLSCLRPGSFGTECSAFPTNAISHKGLNRGSSAALQEKNTAGFPEEIQLPALGLLSSYQEKLRF